jgi:hypothetical protein
MRNENSGTVKSLLVYRLQYSTNEAETFGMSILLLQPATTAAAANAAATNLNAASITGAGDYCTSSGILAAP